MPLAHLRPWARPGDAAKQLLRGATVRTCTPVAAVVGAVLSVVNQGDVVLAGDADGRVLLKVAANLAIPFLTSSTGALLAVRQPLSPALTRTTGAQ